MGKSYATKLLAALLVVSVVLNVLNSMTQDSAESPVSAARQLGHKQRLRRTDTLDRDHKLRDMRGGDADDDQFDSKVDKDHQKKKRPVILENNQEEFGEIKIDIDTLLDQTDDNFEHGNQGEVLNDDDMVMINEYDHTTRAVDVLKTTSTAWVDVEDKQQQITTTALSGAEEEEETHDYPKVTLGMDATTTFEPGNEQPVTIAAAAPPPSKHNQIPLQRHQPKKRFVWVMPHTPGTDEVTGVFGRYILKNKLNPVIAKDGSNIGWPHSKELTSLITDSEQPYDALASGFTRFNKDLMEKLVPNAAYIGLLSHPMMQFSYTWKRYDVGTALHPTLRHFLQFIGKKGWKQTSERKQRLFKDGQSWHLGSTLEPSRELPVLVKELENFDLILISEYLDESLVLLKNVMGWTISDILYLPVSMISKPDRLKTEERQLIRAANRVDMKLFQHFNATLWSKIEKVPEFEAQLNDFKTRKLELQNQCRNISSDLCLSMRMDTQKLNHLFKATTRHDAGVGDKSPSCKPRNKFVWVQTHLTGSTRVTNLLNQYALQHNLSVALPKNDLDFGWPGNGDILSETAQPSGENRQFDALCGGYARYDRLAMGKLVPKAAYITMLRDPLQHFDNSWDHFQMTERINAHSGIEIPKEMFLKEHEKNVMLAKPKDLDLLRGVQKRDLGFDVVDRRALKRFNDEFAMVMIAEHLDESLVLLKRTMCWELKDVVSFSMIQRDQTVKPAFYGRFARNKIMEFNPLDTLLYQHFNDSLWQRIDKEDDFLQEVALLRKMRSEMITSCKEWQKMGVNHHRLALVQADRGHNPISPEEYKCHLSMMNVQTFNLHLKWKTGIETKECKLGHTPRVLFAYIRLDVPGNDLVVQFLQRFILNNKLKIAYPPNFKSFTAPGDNEISYRVSAVGASNDSKDSPDAFCCGFSPLQNGVISSILQDHREAQQKFIILIADPAEVFVHTWLKLDVQNILKDKLNTDVTLNTFLEQPKKYLAMLSYDMQAQLDNPMHMRIGNPLRQSLYPLMIAERLNESIVLLRRYLCWDLQDMVYVAPKLSTHKQSLTEAQLKTIYELNYHDKQLYDTHNLILTRKIAQEVSFQEELTKFEELLDITRRNCDREGVPFSPDNSCSYAELENGIFYKYATKESE